MPTIGTITIIDPETLLSKAGVAKLLGCNPCSIDRLRKQAERQRRENGATDPAERFAQPVWLTDTNPRWRRIDILPARAAGSLRVGSDTRERAATEPELQHPDAGGGGSDMP
jgi:hypothetical protein